MGGFRKVGLLIRRSFAVVFVLACVGTVFLAIFISYREETTDWFLNFGVLHYSAATYIVNISSVDEVAGKASANVQMTLERSAFVELPKVKGPINGKFLLDELDVRIGPLQIRDLGPEFESMGFFALTTFDPISTSPTPDFTTAAPPVSQAEFTLIGDSKLYPFDEYIAIGKVSSVLLASPNRRDFSIIESGRTGVYLRAPNFVMRGASNNELLAHVRLAASREGLELEKKFIIDHPGERQRIFAVLLQRPFFLKVLSVFLLVITVGSATYYAVVSDVKTFSLQALGYFVGLWAVRQMLLAGGPKAFTVVDYTVLLLYALLASVVIGKALWGTPIRGFNPPA